MNVRRIKRHEWLPIVRRLQAKPSVKLVAVMAASYGNGDGGSIFPGIVRLANVTGLDDRTVKAALVELRRLGLLLRVFEGSSCGRRGGMADEHVLTVPEDITALPLLSPDEDDPDRDKQREAARARDVARKRRRRADLSEPRANSRESREISHVRVGSDSTSDNAAIAPLIGELSTSGNAARTKEQVISDAEQVISDTGTGDLRYRRPVTEITPPVHRPVHRPGHENHHSDRIGRDRSGDRPREETYREFEERHRAVMVRPGEQLSDEDEDFVSSRIAEDYVLAKVGDLDAIEESTVLGMLGNGSHPKAIVNTIRKDRGYGESDFRAAQLYLLELDEATRKAYMDQAEDHWSRHFPDEPYMFVHIYAARLAKNRRAS